MTTGLPDASRCRDVGGGSRWVACVETRQLMSQVVWEMDARHATMILVSWKCRVVLLDQQRRSWRIGDLEEEALVFMLWLSG